MYKTVNGNKTTHLIIGRVRSGRFEIIEGFDKKEILDEGIIIGVEDETPEMISLFSTRTGVELFSWKAGEIENRTKLTLSLLAKEGIHYYSVGGDKLLFWFDVGHSDIKTLMASSNPTLIARSKFIKASMYINIAAMIVGSMLFTFVVLTLIPLVIYLLFVVGLNAVIGRLFRDKPNSRIRLVLMSLVTLAASVYVYEVFVLGIFEKTRFIEIYVKNPVLLVLSFTLIYLASFVFANLRSFEIVGEDSSGKWIVNFSAVFFLLYTFNFLQYYFLSSFISNLI